MTYPWTDVRRRFVKIPSPPYGGINPGRKGIKVKPSLGQRTRSTAAGR